MEITNRIGKVSNWITIVSFAASILNIFIKISPIITYGGISIGFLGVLYFLYRYLRGIPITARDILRIIGDTSNFSGIRSSDFETTYNDISIIISDNSEDASMNQKRTVKCHKNNASKYYYRFAPLEKFSNFRHSPGLVSCVERAGGLDVLAQLDRPSRINEIRNFELVAQATKIFSSSVEYWAIHKYYMGNEIEKITIVFPINRNPVVYSSEIIDNDDFNNPLPTTDIISRDVKDGKIVLSLEEKNLKMGQKLYLHWTW